MKKLFGVFALLLILAFNSNAQNVGINNTNPKVALDINGGLATRTKVATPSGNAVNIPENASFVIVSGGAATGTISCLYPSPYIDGQRMVIYNSNSGGYDLDFLGTKIPLNQGREFICSNLSGWTLLSGALGNEGWSLKGNAGTDTSVNFIGTKDNQPLRFKINNENAGIIDRNNGNTGLGYLSLQANGSSNTAVGAAALKVNKGNNNVSIGRNAMFSDSVGINNVAIGSSSMLGSKNSNGVVAIGYQAANSDTAANGVIAIGRAALKNGVNLQNIVAIGDSALYNYTINSGVTHNVAIGTKALYGTSGLYKYQNTAVGSYAMAKNNVLSDNTAIGAFSLYSNMGDGNTAVGSLSLFYNLGGLGNTAVGTESLFKNENGSYNVAMGYTALYSNIDGRNNIALGNEALFYNLNSSGSIAIGEKALRSDSAANGTVAIGRASLYSNNNKIGNLAIGDSALFSNGIGATGLSQATNNLAIGDKALKSNTTGYNNVAIGRHSLINNTVGTNNIAIGTDALFSNQANSRNIVIGDSSMYRTGELTIPEPVLSEKSVDNIVLGRKSLYQGHKVLKNISIGNYTNYSGEWAERNVTIGDSAMYKNYEGTDNVAIGNNSMNGGPNTIYNYSGGNVAIGSFSLYNSGDPYFNSGHNTAIGYYSGYSNHGDVFNKRTGNVFLGNLAGFFAQSANKLYIENTNADSLSALIYGDFAADSLLLNAKTVVRNNAVVKGYTKLGGYGTDVPSIKMKKLSVTNGAAGAVTSFAHGLTQSKILSVAVLVNATTSNDIAPRSTYAGFEYDYYVSSNSIVIKNITGNDTFIAGRPVRILITYEE